MAERYFRFYGLAPTAALQLVATFIREEQGYRALLDELLVQITQPELVGVGAGPRVSLLAADRFAEKRNRKWQDAFAAFSKRYSEVSGSEQPGTTTTLEATQSLQQGVASILQAAHVTDADRVAYKLEREKMIVAPDVSAELFDTLRFEATSVRFATTIADTDTLALYHLQDDQSRFSSLQATLDGDVLGDVVVLDAYRAETRGQNYVVFMPPHLHPEQSALNHFCTILTDYPDLFDGNTTLKSNLLAALVSQPQQNESRLALYLINHLDFYTESSVEAPPPQVSSVNVVQLQNNEIALQQLEQELQAMTTDPARQRGYRLELRRSRYREVNQAEYERLLLTQAEIGERLAELDSFRVARPKLLRFTQTQLPALADVLRSYAVPDLGRLLYGFQGTDDFHAEGLHYLFVPPDIAMNDLDPLIYWEAHDEQPRRFWLDPHWARFYHRYENKALVFVPYGLTLYPSLHSWGVTTMDAYLRDILGPRYHGEQGIQEMPENPVYLFDGTQGAENTIRVTLLDRDSFESVTVRLGWINDNLSLLNRLKLDDLIVKMADDFLRERLAQDASTGAIEAQNRFDTVAQQTGAAVAQRTSDLTTAVTHELTQVVTRSQQFTVQAEELNTRLATIEALHDEMQALATRTEGLIQETETKAIEELESHSDALTVKVERAIEHAERTREKLEAHVAQTIDRLLATQVRLRNELSRLRGEWITVQWSSQRVPEPTVVEAVDEEVPDE